MLLQRWNEGGLQTHETALARVSLMKPLAARVGGLQFIYIWNLVLFNNTAPIFPREN